MHNHPKDNNNSGMKGMMWMMVICCAVLILPFLFLGGRLGGGSIWPILGVMAVVFGLHFFMHRGHHGKHMDEKTPHTSDDKTL
jgi:uncharacterized membrane protein